MANIFVSVEKGIVVGAEDVLKWLTSTSKTIACDTGCNCGVGHACRRSGEAAERACGSCRKSAEHCAGR